MDVRIHFFCNYFKNIAEEANRIYQSCIAEESEEEYQSPIIKEVEYQYRIIKEIARQKEVGKQIKEKLAQFASDDERIKSYMWEIKKLERRQVDDRHINPWSKKNSLVQITNGVVSLTHEKDMYGKDLQLVVDADRKRCQKKLIKKGVMDVEYLEQVQEELMTTKKSSGMTSSGTRQLNDLALSLGHRIQHGNDTRAHERKIYQEIKSVNETRELYSAPEPEPPSHYSQYDRRVKVEWKLYKQQHINYWLDQIEIEKWQQKGRKSKVTRLKENLELVRKNISSLNKELETFKNEAYKCADNLGDQKKDMVKSLAIMTYAEKLARKGVVGLKLLCMRDNKVELFVRWWCSYNGFKDDYKTMKLPLWTVRRQGLRDDYETRKLPLKRL